ncbi:MAG: undecaprenyl-diphosphate phosphatase [Candidatus Aureabacteria bacterium]|jgi:undecaprenyl-diphosphatase|nr:undecaprenyl-diphosphate phosphatase [Candidatus Auribacterota bacterium]NLW93292.1 undecaprenyl-diphosphate phosphatase [Chlamydiota bacterium]HOE26336.1 undecaprenyl-diphosphate phosphatase [bacterium]
MTIPQAVVIGIVQGATEWLPVSSTAHLVLAERLLGVRSEGVALELVLHLGTLAAAVVFYRAAWRRILLHPAEPRARRDLGLLLVATLPAAAVGVLARGWLEARFHDPRMAAAGLVAGGVFLVAAGRARPADAEIGWGRALLIGCAQALALPPGISRSGMTVGAGLLAGVGRRRAVEFAFMMAAPAMLGAALMHLPEIGSAAENFGVAALAASAAVSCASGLVAIRVLNGAVERGGIAWFGCYCIALGVAWALWG